MKTNFCVVSDGSCDLPEQILKEHNISVVHFLVSFDGKTYQREGIDIELKDFYQRMVDHPNIIPKTATPSPQDFYAAFEARAKEGQDIICICISTKLSSSVQSAEIAAQMLKEKYPDIRVVVLDSLCATLMQAVYVLEVCRMRDAGYSLDHTVEMIKRLGKTARILFTVGDLHYLQKGGRIGKVTSIAGNLLNVKPLITLQDGEIHSSGIRRGRRKSLNGIIDLLINYCKDYNCAPTDCNIIIGYCHDYEEAVRFQKLTEERLCETFGNQISVPLCPIGATIGVHAGPYSIGYGVIQRSDFITHV